MTTHQPSFDLDPQRAALLDAALQAAGHGWHVFPLTPGEKRPPAIRAWESRATTDTQRIRRCWQAGPYNVAIAAGPSNLVVLDLDVAKPGKEVPEDCKRWGAIHGAQMLARLAEAEHAELPDTRTVRTPSGGTHLYFRQPDGARLGSTKGSLAGLIDTRGWGGYVVAPSSITAEGRYELIDDREPVELPGWLLQRLTDRPSVAVSAPREIASAKVNSYVAAAIEGECRRVRTAISGRHNKVHMIAALALGQLVGAGHLDRNTALPLLQRAAEPHITGPCDCTERGVTATFAWGLDVGARNPRRLSTEDGAA